MLIMPPRSKLNLPPLKLGEESFGERLSRIRKQRGLSQIALAEKMGIIQQLVTDYERERLRMHAEMIVRFAKALDVSTDELLLGDKAAAHVKNGAGVSLKVAKRLQRIDRLPATRQKALLQTIDAFLGQYGE